MFLTGNDTVLFAGDSITHGGRGESMDCNHIMGHGYQFTVAGVLACENLERMPKFVNKGHSGYTMKAIYDCWQEDVLKFRPSVLSILAGTNDCLKGSWENLSVKETADTYEMYLKKAVDDTRSVNENVKIIICEPFYFPIYGEDKSFDNAPHPYCEENRGRADREETNEQKDYKAMAIKEVAKRAEKTAKEKNCIFVPLCDELEKAIKASHDGYVIWDGTHPSVVGHEIIARQWLKTVNGL